MLDLCGLCHSGFDTDYGIAFFSTTIRPENDPVNTRPVALQFTRPLAAIRLMNAALSMGNRPYGNVPCTAGCDRVYS